MPDKQVKSALFDKLVDQLRTRSKLEIVKRDATNAFNRHNTQCNKSFAALMQEQNLPAKTIVNIDGTEYVWAVTESRCIDPRQWHKLWQDGEITDDQYFEALAVSKAEAKRMIGDDQVETISIDIRGTKADIRVDASNAGIHDGVRVIIPDPITKPIGIRARPGSATPVQVPAPKRKVTVGK